MCSAPKIPAPQPVPTRQAARTPATVESGDRMADRLRRRVGFAAAIRAGSLGAPSTTAGTSVGTGITGMMS